MPSGKESRRFLDLTTIPLADIANQNARMHAGENNADDLIRHAEEWIATNRDLVDQWLSEAREATR